ncbi:MAG: hypothetical protein JJ966_05300 [Balneolaceae bacterium]|nr:hypothetical protein [Balneolaceae bacterium]
MKNKLGFAYFFIALTFSSCQLFVDDCFMARGTFGNFYITNTVPDFSLAIHDSVIIDMSKYWRGDIGCEKEEYTPLVIFSNSNSDLFELRSVDKYLIIKGIKTGTSTISVMAERKYDSDDCLGTNISSPIQFEVTVEELTSLRFEDNLEWNGGNRLLNVEYEPKSFTIGDTLVLKAVASDTSIKSISGHWKYDYKWVFKDDYKFKILTRDMGENCEAGNNQMTRNTLEIVMLDSTDSILGFVHVQNGGGSGLRNGISFRMIPEL